MINIKKFATKKTFKIAYFVLPLICLAIVLLTLVIANGAPQKNEYAGNVQYYARHADEYWGVESYWAETIEEAGKIAVVVDKIKGVPVTEICFNKGELDKVQELLIQAKPTEIGGAEDFARADLRVYFEGTPSELQGVEWWYRSDYKGEKDRAFLNNWYYYSENRPTVSGGNYWHYDSNRQPVAW